MHWLRRLRARLFGFLYKREIEEGINEEIRFHIAARTEEYIAGGMSPEEAAREASRQFGNVLSVKDAWRDVSGGGVLDVLWQDLRFAARMLLRDRVFTIVAVLALALGIGVNTALFTILSNVILRPLAFPEPNRIMSIWSRDGGTTQSERIPFSYPDFLDISGGNKTFSKVGGFRSSSFVVKGPSEDAVQMQGALSRRKFSRFWGQRRRSAEFLIAARTNRVIDRLFSATSSGRNGSKARPTCSARNCWSTARSIRLLG